MIKHYMYLKIGKLSVRYLIMILVIIVTYSCSNSATKDNKTQLDTDNIVSSKTQLDTLNEVIVEKNLKVHYHDSVIAKLISKSDTSNHDYFYEIRSSDNSSLLIFTGYTDYSSDEFEFENPAYLKAFRGSKLIFEDNFTGYEEIRLEDFDGYLFNDSIRLFSLKYGLAACDYINPERLYYAYNDKVGLISDFYSQSTDYASKYIEYELPTDTGGIDNMIIVYDRIHYYTGEEPDKADTVLFEFNGEQFFEATAANKVYSK